MMPELKIWMEYASVSLMIGGLLGKLFGGDDDGLVLECHDVVLDALSDADRTRTTECVTDKNWRDQLSVEEAQALHEERELRAMGKRRN
jgi:hypothetical protein